MKNLHSHNGGATFKVIIDSLSKLGYKVYHQVLNAKDFGLPQNRQRIAIICIKKNIANKDFEFPLPKQKLITISDIKENDNITNKYVIKRDDIKIDETKLTLAIAGGKVNKPLQIGIIGRGVKVIEYIMKMELV